MRARIAAASSGLSLPRSDFLREQRFGVSLAFARLLRGRVDQHDVHARPRRDVRDARAHHSGAEHAELRDLAVRHALGSADELVGEALVDEHRAHQVARDRPRQQCREVLALDREPEVDRQLRALVDRRQDRERRREVPLGAARGQRRAGHEHLCGARVHRTGPSRHPEALAIPRGQRLAAAEDPAPRTRDDLGLRGHLVHESFLQRLRRRHRPALGQELEPLHHPDQARHALRAAGAGQQPDRDLGLTDGGLRVVGDHAVVARKRDLEAAAQRDAVDRRREGLAAGLDAPEQPGQRRDAIAGLDQRDAAIVGVDHVLDVGAGHERGLARREHGAADRGIARHAIDARGVIGDEARRQYVHRPIGDVHRDQRDTVGIDLEAKILVHACRCLRRVR